MTSTATLSAAADRLVSGGRGILAADESIRTMSERLEGAGVPASATARRDYRQLLVTAPGLAEAVSGVILSDETFRSELADGTPFATACHQRGILPGIKVDTGTEEIPDGGGALITTGLDGLDERLAEYADLGATFAKWRAVIDVTTASDDSIHLNAEALAAYAAACQRQGIVPIVEPEVLAAGSHDMVACALATRRAQQALFMALADADVDLSGLVLKPNFVTPGLDCQQVTPRVVATITYDVLRDAVPAAVAGIAFLSGGHPTDRVCDFLAALNRFAGVPWPCTFSFGRALVNDALALWAGDPANVGRAQEALLANCRSAVSAVDRAA